MPVDNSMLLEITENVWSRMLGLPLSFVPDDLDDVSEPRLVGRIEISGPPATRVTLDIPTALARKSAAVIFNVDANDVEEDDVVDAVAELTNVVGGNVKGLFPVECSLSLPVVRPDAIETSPPCRFSSIVLNCDGHRFAVHVDAMLD